MANIFGCVFAPLDYSVILVVIFSSLLIFCRMQNSDVVAM
jgi:hypothetical protein